MAPTWWCMAMLITGDSMVEPQPELLCTTSRFLCCKRRSHPRCIASSTSDGIVRARLALVPSSLLRHASRRRRENVIEWLRRLHRRILTGNRDRQNADLVIIRQRDGLRARRQGDRICEQIGV